MSVSSAPVSFYLTSDRLMKMSPFFFFNINLHSAKFLSAEMFFSETFLETLLLSYLSVLFLFMCVRASALIC